MPPPLHCIVDRNHQDHYIIAESPPGTEFVKKLAGGLVGWLVGACSLAPALAPPPRTILILVLLLVKGP